MSELGSLLKQNRKEKGMSLDELQQKTKIQKRYLEAIERGKFDVLPGDFYTRAFIRTYAEVVGLNADEAMTLYRAEVPVKEAAVEEVTRANNQKEPRELPVFLLGKGFKLIVVALIVLVIGGIWLMMYVKGNNSDDAVVDQTPATSVSIDEATKTKESSKTEQSASKEKSTDEKTDKVTITAPEANSGSMNYVVEAASVDELTMTIEATGGDSWNSITTNTGEAVESGLLAAGDKKEIKLVKPTNLNVTIGNSQGLNMSINDEKLEFATDAITQNITIEFKQK